MAHTREYYEQYNQKRREARAAAKARGERLESDQKYLERKKLQRQLKRLEKEQKATSSKERKKEITKQKRLLKKDIQSTYTRKKGKTAKTKTTTTTGKPKSTKKTKQTLQQRTANQTVSNIAKKSGGLMSDEAFKKAMNLAQKEGSWDGITRLQVQLFWKATMKMWSGQNYADRIKAIKNALGVTTLHQAFRKVMAREDVKMYQENIEEYKRTQNYEYNAEYEVDYDEDGFPIDAYNLDTLDDIYQDEAMPDTKYAVSYFIVR